MFGDPALHLLWRRKLRGTLRRQGRRLKTVKGALLSLLGMGILGVWFTSVFFYSFSSERPASSPDDVADMVRIGALLMLVITSFSALNHRGLYVPKEEIERLFSAPVSRANIVRYRLTANLGRSLVGALVVALVFTKRTPEPLFGFAGVFVAMATLPVLGQAASILSGGLEKRLVGFLQGPARVVPIVLAVGVGAVAWSLMMDFSAADVAQSGLLPASLPDFLSTVREHAVVAWVLLPFEPWARAVSATDAATFWPWFAVCLGVWLLAFELTARLPLDFRELSLETAAKTAERLRRMRRVGGGASASKAKRGWFGRRLPWIFGRGPGGAIAWRKSVEIVRKARGTLWISTLVLIALMFVSGAIGAATEEGGVLAQVVFTAMLGTLYLCSGLRFDFRDDLDRMETIRAWPLSSRRLFLFSLLPETLLVSALLFGAIGLRLVLSSAYDPLVPAVAAYLPLVVFAWLALDNAVFLFSPVRFVPGQDGTLQNAGRAILLVFLRLSLLALVTATVGGIGFGIWAALQALGVESTAVLLAAVLVIAWLVLLGLDALLIVAGGWLLGRFDVARDRG